MARLSMGNHTCWSLLCMQRIHALTPHAMQTRFSFSKLILEVAPHILRVFCRGQDAV